MIKSIDSFHTPRLVARKLESSDTQLLYLMNQNTQIMATLGGVCDEIESNKRLMWNLEQWQTNGFGLWLFYDKSTNDFVGRGGLRRLMVDGKEEIEVAYAIMPEFWTKGFATEITSACIKFAFTHYKLQSVVALTQVSNKASERVMQKVGFTYEKNFIHHNMPHVLYRMMNLEG